MVVKGRSHLSVLFVPSKEKEERKERRKNKFAEKIKVRNSS